MKNNRPKMKRIAAALISASFAGALVSCSGATGAESQGKGALAMGYAGMDISIWNDTLKYMEPIIEEAGYEFLTSDPQWDVQRQVADWDAWVQRGDVKAIMGFPVQPDSMVPVTARAKEAGIPVVAYATKWEGADIGMLIDSYKDGYQLGEAAGTWINENKANESEVPVAVIADKTTELGSDRAKGMIDALHKTAPNVRVYELPGLSRTEGNDNAKSQLTAVPETKVWLGTSNDNMAGAYQAILDSGVDPADPSYFVGSMDGTNETLDIVGQPGSIWRALFIMPAKELAAKNAELLLGAAEGASLKDVFVTSTRVSPENIQDLYVK